MFHFILSLKDWIFLFTFKSAIYISVRFSFSLISDSLWPHGQQHARLSCPSPTPRAYSNSCPSSQWCHATISSSVLPLSSFLQSFPASGSFPMSQFFAWGGQHSGASASASVLSMSIQDWFPLGLTDLISRQTFKTLKSLLQHNSSKASVLCCSARNAKRQNGCLRRPYK